MNKSPEIGGWVFRYIHADSRIDTGIQMLIHFLLILVLASLYTCKMIVQSKFCRQRLKSPSMLLWFNCGMFLTSALIMLCSLIIEKDSISLTTAIYGSAFGLVSVIYQIVYANALQTGSSSLTVLIVNFSCIVPMAFGLIFWNEPITIPLATGAMLTIVSLLFSHQRKENEVSSKRIWPLMVTLCFAANSAALLLQKFYQFTPYATQRSGYLLVSNLVGACGSAIIAGIRKSRNTQEAMTWDKTLLFSAILSGVLIGAYHKIGLLLTGKMNASIYYPLLNGTTMILCILASTFLLKEKLTKRILFSIVFGIGAIIALSI